MTDQTNPSEEAGLAAKARRVLELASSAEIPIATAESCTGGQLASLLTFRVSDAARRRKVDGARTRGPHAVRYGDFDFALIPTAADGADKRKGPIAAGPILR